ncbi:hypothetical protein AWC38_SpisGene21869 [Stylophora pistillata]|uniref:HECT domain-containing protein n=1 Tax=Stylophora pistillata TaxID=50429 RepID=A0A2B4RCN3_STYPI|nr:hypothetical protein AWC38_SpisGene21869 [Stylophora pistillata]
MLNSSQSSASGLAKRLNKCERLLVVRATSTANDQAQRKKAKKEDPKAFEFELLSLGDDDEDEWTISDDKIMLRGLIQLSPESSEADIRRKLGEVTRVKFPTVTYSDFVFLRAIRKKLSIPVTCDSFAYKQLKVVAGQGALYVKLKPGFDCLLENNVNSDDGTSLRLYADDTTAYASDTSPIVLPYIINSDLQIARTWLQHNYLQINATKTQAMAIGPVKYRYDINLQDDNVELTDSLKILGVILDERITCKPYIQVQLKKACAETAAMRKLQMDKLAEEAVAYCQENNISNPSEILRVIQNKFVKGRNLKVQGVDEVSQGMAQYNLVDRTSILVTAFEELKDVALTDLRKTLQVDFYGEEAQDLGGPRKEFFRLLLSEIYTTYFEKGLKDHLAEDYLTVGLSILQNGKMPHFLEEDILQEIFSSSPMSPNSAIQHWRNGLKCLGIHQIGCQLPMFWYLLRRDPNHKLTVKQLVQLLKLDFSLEGLNSHSLENKVYAAFVKYLREVARIPIKINIYFSNGEACHCIPHKSEIGHGSPVWVIKEPTDPHVELVEVSVSFESHDFLTSMLEIFTKHWQTRISTIEKSLSCLVRCHSPQCTWVMMFSAKMAGNQIRNGDWMQDQTLKGDLLKYVRRKNWKKREILDFIESKCPMYAWSERTLARRRQYFEIKFTNYEVDIEDVKEAVRREMDGPGQLLGYRSMQQKVREIHGLNVPRDIVYAVMKEVSPEGLQARGGVGKAKRHGRSNTFVTGKEVDTFRVSVWNNHCMRKQKAKELPDGVPEHIYMYPQNYGGEKCGLTVTEQQLQETAELSGMLEGTSDYLEAGFRRECERHIPDTNDVEPAQAANAYLFLKNNFDVNRV